MKADPQESLASHESIHSLQEDTTKCSICLEVYRNPHVLTQCSHTFCLECIQKLEKGNEVECPQCKTLNRYMAHVKKDFDKQNLIDDPSEKGESKSDSQKCDTDKVICGLKKEVADIDKQLENVLQDVKKVEESKTKNMNDLEEFTQGFINEIKKNERRLKIIINDANDQVVKKLAKSETILRKHKEEILSKINQIESLMGTEDTETLQDTLNKVSQETESEAKKRKESISLSQIRLTPSVRSPVSVKKGKKLDIKASIELIFRSEIQPLSQENYSELWTKTFQESERIELNYAPERLIWVNSHLWCVACDGSLHIYDEACQTVKTNHGVKFTWQKGLTVSDRGHVLLAFSKSQFLPERMIDEGDFGDVQIYNEDLYILEYKQSTLLVFKRSGDKWIPKNKYKLQHRNGDVYDRVCVSTTTIYVSSYNNHSVYIYNKQGKLQRQIGDHDNRPGEFDCPLLCGADEDGNILVADCNNHRLKLYQVNAGTTGDRETGRVLALPIEVNYPRHAVVGDGGQMWIIQLNPNVLVKLM